MLNPEREPLKEKVEVDETYLGGHEAGLKGGRQLLDKALVVGTFQTLLGLASGVHGSTTYDMLYRSESTR